MVLPVLVRGIVIEGFGRGSKLLGCPTANFPQDVVDNLPTDLDPGVYCGWASLNSGPVYEMVMNVGWCPFYQNEKKSMETHVLHKFDEDFYGGDLKVCIVKYLRPEKNFSCLDDLINAIQSDIQNAKDVLKLDEFLKFKEHSFFQTS